MEQNIVEFTFSPAKMFDLYLQGHGIKYSWVAQNLDLSTDYIIKICSEKLSLPPKTRQKINELLETNY